MKSFEPTFDPKKNKQEEPVLVASEDRTEILPGQESGDDYDPIDLPKPELEDEQESGEIGFEEDESKTYIPTSAEMRNRKPHPEEAAKIFADETRFLLGLIKDHQDLGARKDAYKKLAEKAAEFYGVEPDLRSSLSDRYVLLEKVNEGGMGEVYDAYDQNLDTSVIVKFIKRSSPEALKRFKREATSMAKFASPYVVRIFDAGWSETDGWYSMEKIEGENLLDRLSKGELKTIGDVAKAALDMARGIRDLQKQGIVHRDIKPANILYRPETDTYQLTDFGLAQDSAKESLEQEGSVVGTPRYMSPEQVQGLHNQISSKTDLWALGDVLYEMISGSIPFNGKSSYGVMQNILLEQPEHLANFYEIPPELGDLAIHLLEKKPQDRPEVEEVIQVLSRFVDNELPIRTPKAATGDVTKIMEQKDHRTNAHKVSDVPSFRQRTKTVFRKILGK